MKVLRDIFHITSAFLLFFILPLVVFTLITSRTDMLGGVRSFVVLSGSMEPMLPVGSVVYTYKELTPREGDIIAFTRSGEVITHRIHAVLKRNNAVSFSTKGDANNADDTQPVSLANVLGKEFFYLPYVGYLIVFLRTVPGFILLIVVPGLLFIALEFGKINKEIEKEVEKKLLKKMQAT